MTMAHYPMPAGFLIKRIGNDLKIFTVIGNTESKFTYVSEMGVVAVPRY